MSLVFEPFLWVLQSVLVEAREGGLRLGTSLTELANYSSLRSSSYFTYAGCSLLLRTAMIFSFNKSSSSTVQPCTLTTSRLLPTSIVLRMWVSPFNSNAK